jgi:hypothetical protein
MHRRSPFLLAAALATLAAPVWAGATVEIVSQSPAGIYLDGEYLGPAPMTLTNLAPGLHTVEASMAGGRRSFKVVSPSMADVHRVLELDGAGLVQPQPVSVPAPAPVVQTVSYQDPCATACESTQVVYQPAPVRRVVYTPPPETVYLPPAPVCTTPDVYSPAPVYRRSNRHVRVRNTLLGLGAAAFLFKKLDDRHDRRNQYRWNSPAPVPPPVARAPRSGGGRMGRRGNNGRGPGVGPGRRVGPPGGGIPGGRGSRGRGGGRGPL